jgi:hypothetical protein
MGVDRTVTFPGEPPAWPAVASRLAGRGLAVAVRMIDGLPAFPDEEPPAEWRELRVGADAGMVTLRRTPDGVACVTWGNADPQLRRLWDAVTWALADAGGGQVLTTEGAVPAEEFARQAGL